MELFLKDLIQYNEDWKDLDNFSISFEAAIGSNDETDLFYFYVVSPKRLEDIVFKNDIFLGQGYLIMKDFNINKIRETIDKLIKKSKSDNYNKSIQNLSKYFLLRTK